jgi:hypothetical protein
MTALTKIGECYSGLLAGPRSRYHRVVLATPAAIEKLTPLPPYHPATDAIRNPAVKIYLQLNQLGLAVIPYKSWRNTVALGLRLAGSAEETHRFNEGVDRLASLEPGIHRKIALRMMGIEIDTATEELSPKIYASLFAKVEEHFLAPDFKDIAAISIAEIPFDFAESRPNGNLWRLSRAQLEVYPKMSYLKIPKAE